MRCRQSAVCPDRPHSASNNSCQHCLPSTSIKCSVSVASSLKGSQKCLQTHHPFPLPICPATVHIRPRKGDAGTSWPPSTDWSTCSNGPRASTITSLYSTVPFLNKTLNQLRLPGTGSAQILINPFGLLYHEVTAGSLIKLNLAGDVLDQGSTNLGVNQAAYVLHSAIHDARPGKNTTITSAIMSVFYTDIHCVLHLHTAVVSAVGSMKCGLLPICQEAMIIGPVGYHDYQVFSV